MSGQVALARRSRWLEVIGLAVFAVLAMAGVAYATIRAFAWSGGLPDGLLRLILLGSVSFWGIPLAATTIAALWLARRVPLPRRWIHWAMTAAAGLLMYPLAARASARFDMLNAVADGTVAPSSAAPASRWRALNDAVRWMFTTGNLRDPMAFASRVLVPPRSVQSKTYRG